ncbi:MAG: DegT/DnrJ/EryC1/StrS family aminotransferase [Bradymonadia bacterium]
MSVPFLDLKAQLGDYREEALAAFVDAMDAQAFIMGARVKTFEESLAAYTGVGHAIGVSSGTDALMVALMALGVGPGDEVITTPFTFFATAGVIARLGARPVFADIDPGTFNLTGEAINPLVNTRTKAILPVHLFGQIADLDALAPESPPVVEDAAQSLGATRRGKMTGHHGALSCISFFPTKNLGAFGDGGAVITTDAELADRCTLLRVHGARPKYHHAIVGGNFRLDALQAAILSVKLPHLEAWTEARRANAARYVAMFTESGLVERGLITLPVVLDDNRHVYNQFVVRAKDRDALKAHLAAQGIGSMIYYPKPLHLQACFADLGHGPGDFPAAEEACASVLALPIYGELTAEQQHLVVEAIAGYYGV